MKILLVGNAMDNFSGQPMSTYESARVLSRDHEVTVICKDGFWCDNELKQNLEKLGVKCTYDWEPKYDLIIASEWMPPVEGFKINTVRGIYWDETPIDGCDWYVCIRPDIQQHIIEEHAIPEEKTVVIYNGVDRTRFKEKVKSPRDHLKVVAPCNVDKLRQRWLNHMISMTTRRRQLYIYAKEFTATVNESPWVHYMKPTFYMEDVIADADVVVGIYLGRVNLEAASCHVPSIIYDPVTLEAVPFDPSEEEFEEVHNIENVVKRILALYAP